MKTTYKRVMKESRGINKPRKQPSLSWAKQQTHREQRQITIQKTAAQEQTNPKKNQNITNQHWNPKNMNKERKKKAHNHHGNQKTLMNFTK